MGDQRFDGVDVELFGGRFKGAFDVPEDQGSDMAYDEVYSFVVTARVGDVDFRENKTGDLRRINVLELQEVVVLTPQLHSLVSSALTSGGAAAPSAPASSGGGTSAASAQTPGIDNLSGQTTVDEQIDALLAEEEGDDDDEDDSESTLRIESTTRLPDPDEPTGQVEQVGRVQGGGDEHLRKFLED